MDQKPTNYGFVAESKNFWKEEPMMMEQLKGFDKKNSYISIDIYLCTSSKWQKESLVRIKSINIIY